MCGIAGIVNSKAEPVNGEALIRMAETLRHRGPDGEGFSLLGPRPADCRFLTRDGLRDVHSHGESAGFAHRRLAIIDLSDAGTQPMCDPAGRLWITYNGEVFNYIELRAELQTLGRQFHTSTDTEVLLQAYAEWGPDCLSRLNGMWAFAIWDTRRQHLFLARDRFGIKPLYYVQKEGKLAFASEPKALLQLSWVDSQADERAVADYLVHGRQDCFRWTFYKDIQRLEPGHYADVPFSSSSHITQTRWWHIEETLADSPASDTDTQAQFLELFKSAVELRLRSDVPVGTCLSGGLDSTAVVCVARPWLKKENQKTYSAVYDASFKEDETGYIDEVLRYTNVENCRCRPTGETLLVDLNTFIRQQDEPFGSTSQYAQYKVFELVRRSGTVVTLDGQGADEELGGYHYFFPVFFAGLLARMKPIEAIRQFSRYCRATSASPVTSALATAAGFLPHRAMIRWANRYDPSRSVAWVIPEVMAQARAIRQPEIPQFGDRLNRRLYEVFAVSGLPALLRYEDRNSMAWSVEARLPFMDHRLVSYLFSLPDRFKMRDGYTKHVMRKALRGRIPELVRGRADKIGFATPEAEWYRTSCLPLMREVFASETTRRRGLFRIPELLALLETNACGKVNAGRPLWRALNLELWFRIFVD